MPRISVKEARKAAGLKQREVAEMMSISRPTYIAMEKNPKRITWDEADKLANIFGVEIHDLAFR